MIPYRQPQSALYRSQVVPDKIKDIWRVNLINYNQKFQTG